MCVCFHIAATSVIVSYVFCAFINAAGFKGGWVFYSFLLFQFKLTIDYHCLAMLIAIHTT